MKIVLEQLIFFSLFLTQIKRAYKRPLYKYTLAPVTELESTKPFFSILTNLLLILDSGCFHSETNRKPKLILMNELEETLKMKIFPNYYYFFY